MQVVPPAVLGARDQGPSRVQALLVPKHPRVPVGQVAACPVMPMVPERVVKDHLVETPSVPVAEVMIHLKVVLFLPVVRGLLRPLVDQAQAARTSALKVLVGRVPEELAL